MCVCVCVHHVQLFVTLWTVAHQVPLCMWFSWQEYRSGLPFPPPEDIPNPGIKPKAPAVPALQEDSLPTEPLTILILGYTLAEVWQWKPDHLDAGHSCAITQLCDLGQAFTLSGPRFPHLWSRGLGLRPSLRYLLALTVKDSAIFQLGEVICCQLLLVLGTSVHMRHSQIYQLEKPLALALHTALPRIKTEAFAQTWVQSCRVS